MTNRVAPSLAKWPFIVGDLILLVVAGWIVNQSPDPFSFWPLFFLVGCVAGGAWIIVYPFLAEYQSSVKLAESEGLNDAVAKINQIQNLADAIGHATGQWQDIQNQATQTTSAAQSVSEQMAEESKAFAEFMQKTNDSEKAHLRLEVEKLRRSENEWVQTLVLLMDHVYGIFAAAVRSGKKTLIDQLAQYQRACREVVRRIGLIPVEVAAGEPYQEAVHQLADPEAALPENPVVELTLATGYTYQGQVIRKPLVSIRQPAAPPSATPSLTSSSPAPGELFQLESETVSPAASASKETAEKPPSELEPEPEPESESEPEASPAADPQEKTTKNSF